MNDRWSDSSAGNVQANTDVTDKLRKAAKATKSAPASITEGSMSAGTLATLIGTLLAALAVAGGIAAALMKFGRSEPIVRREPGGRPDLWAGRTERDATDIYANDFRSSPIDLDATFRKPAAQPAAPRHRIKTSSRLPGSRPPANATSPTTAFGRVVQISVPRR